VHGAPIHSHRLLVAGSCPRVPVTSNRVGAVGWAKSLACRNRRTQRQWRSPVRSRGQVLPTRKTIAWARRARFCVRGIFGGARLCPPYNSSGTRCRAEAAHRAPCARGGTADTTVSEAVVARHGSSSLSERTNCPCGGMADAAVSKAAVFRDVQVRVLLGAPIRGCGGNARRRTLKPSRISDACGLDSHLPHQFTRA
jgi:hypothetical protein